MRKRDILGSFVKRPGVLYKHAIKKIADEPVAYSVLITYLPGCIDLRYEKDGKEVSVPGEGYKMLRYLSLDEEWCLITFYTPNNELIQWYFDISKGNFLDEYGMPWVDDIYLDVIITPDGNARTVDEDELQEALDRNEITEDDFNHAYEVRDRIIESKWSDVTFLTEFSKKLFEFYLTD